MRDLAIQIKPLSARNYSTKGLIVCAKMYQFFIELWHWRVGPNVCEITAGETAEECHSFQVWGDPISSDEEQLLPDQGVT